MSKNTTAKTYSWDRYVKEAARDPFVLDVSGEEIVIAVPSGTALIRISQGMREADLELMLRALVGEQWSKIETLLAQAGYEAFEALVDDMLEHFGLNQEMTLVGPGGGKVTASRPKEIQRLLRMGYVVQGEAPASQA